MTERVKFADDLWLVSLNLAYVESLMKLKYQMLSEMPWAMITCLDSGRGEWLKKLFLRHVENFNMVPEFHILDSGNIVLSGKDVCRLGIEERLFGGDNEVCFFSATPPEQPVEGMIWSALNRTDAESKDL